MTKAGPTSEQLIASNWRGIEHIRVGEYEYVEYDRDESPGHVDSFLCERNRRRWLGRATKSLPSLPNRVRELVTP